jgi:hypothetical protein
MRPVDGAGFREDVVQRYEPDAIHEAAVERVVAVVAQHEDMPWRHQIFGRVVHFALVGRLDDIVPFAIRQRLDVPPQRDVDTAVVGDIVVFLLARAKLAVDVELALPQLDAIARQADDPFDVVRRVVAWILENHHMPRAGTNPAERSPATR